MKHHTNLSGETKTILMLMCKDQQTRTAYKKAMINAEITFSKKRKDMLKKLNHDLTNEE